MMIFEFTLLVLTSLQCCRNGIAASATLTISGNGVILKGSAATVSCVITNYAPDNLAGLYIMTGQNALPGELVVLCSQDTCRRGAAVKDRYTYDRNSTGLFLDITNSNYSEDRGWWRCNLQVGDINSDAVLLDVYSTPTGVAYISPPTSAKDLADSSVTFTCEATGCTYPAPMFTWYYMENNNNVIYQAASSGTLVTSTDCEQHEGKYQGTLTLPRYTEFSDRSRKTTSFKCGLSHDALSSDMFTSSSVQVTFAVHVQSVSLKDGGNTPAAGTEIWVVNGTTKTLTVEWLPTTSAPSPTLTCYVNNREHSVSGSTFTFTAREQDHQGDVYCQAINTNDQSTAVVTNTLKLYVVVPLTSIALLDGSNTPGNGENVEMLNNNQHSLTVVLTPSNNRPPSTVRCFIGNTSYNVQGAAFNISVKNEDHGKDVYCRATSTYDQSTVDTYRPTIYVIVEVANVTVLNFSSSGLIMLEGKRATVLCRTTPTRPAAEIVWDIDGSPQNDVVNTTEVDGSDLYTVTSTVSLIAIRAYDQKDVGCKARVATQAFVSSFFSSERVVINVWHPPAQPKVIEVGASFPWLAGNQGTLTCSTTDSGKPEASVTWTHDGTATEENNNLVFQSLQSADNNRTVSCELRNGYTTQTGERAVSVQILIHVEYRPFITITSNGEQVQSPQTLTEGTDKTFKCEATGNPSPTVIKWQTESDDHLAFTNINRTQADIYICNATATSTKHGELKSSEELDVIVHYAPDIRVNFTNSAVKENESITVICDPHGIPANYSYHRIEHRWGSTVIRNQSGSKEWLINSADLQDSGTYTCFVDNNIPDRNNKKLQNGSADMMVQVGPKILLSNELKKFSGEPGKTATMNVPFYSYPEINSLILMLGSSEINNTQKHNISYHHANVSALFYETPVQLQGYVVVISVNNLTEVDFGNYSLRLGNVIQNITDTLELRASSHPVTPVLLIFSALTPGKEITINWRRGFNGGHPQVFIIQYSVSGRDDWKNFTSVAENDESYQYPNGSYGVNITGLSPDTYDIRVFASNEKGISGMRYLREIIIPDESRDMKAPSSSPLTAIGAAVGAVVVISVVALIVVIWYRRRGGKKDKLTNSGDMELNGADAEEDEIIINDLYSGGPVVNNGPSSSNGAPSNDSQTYAQVVKPKKVPPKHDENLYAVVDKTKKNGDKPKGDASAELYATPIKKGKGKGKGKKDKKAAKESSGRDNFDAGMVYENAATVGLDQTGDSNVYENPEQSALPAPGPKKKRNKDGLLYADLEFVPTKKGDKKLVIHGLENTTEYAEVVIGKRGEPLPESDDESKSNDDSKQK